MRLRRSMGIYLRSINLSCLDYVTTVKEKTMRNHKTYDYKGTIYSYRHIVRHDYSLLSLKVRKYTEIIINIPYGKWLQPFHLDSMQNEKTLTKRERTYNYSQMLSLEGDFDKYFQLYSPLKYEVEVLEILDPHQMLKLIQEFNIYDISTDGIYLIFTLEDGVTTQTIRPIAHKMIELFHEKLIERPDRININRRFLKEHHGSYRSIRIGRRKFPF